MPETTVALDDQPSGGAYVDGVLVHETQPAGTVPPPAPPFGFAPAAAPEPEP